MERKEPFEKKKEEKHDGKLCIRVLLMSACVRMCACVCVCICV